MPRDKVYEGSFKDSILEKERYHKKNRDIFHERFNLRNELR
jgi:hypothetical protein